MVSVQGCGAIGIKDVVILQNEVEKLQTEIKKLRTEKEKRTE